MTDTPDPYAYDRSQHEALVLAWRRARLARLTAPDSWLSLIGRFPLEPGDNRAGAAAGCSIALPADTAPSLVGNFECHENVVTFTPSEGVALSLRGSAGERPLTAGVSVTLQSDRNGTPDKVVFGTITMEVMERQSGVFVRVRDPESPARTQFPGIEHYSINPKWRVVARFEPYVPPMPLDLGYETGSAEHYVSPGAAVFEIDGVTHRIDPVLDSNGQRLYVVFWDQTGRDTTYGAGRFLYAPLPAGDRVLLDFNQAFSPPCAFTPYALCPLPPPQNRLAVRVEAGEKRPHE